MYGIYEFQYETKSFLIMSILSRFEFINSPIIKV